MADGSTENIEYIRTGNLVLSFDEETGSNVPAEVTGVLSHIVEGYYVIDDHLKITATNPIWAGGEWKDPPELAVGDVLMTTEGEIDYVDSIGYIEEEVEVYNLQVVGTHTYYAEGLRVHNKAEDLSMDMGGPVARFIGVRKMLYANSELLVLLGILVISIIALVWKLHKKSTV